MSQNHSQLNIWPIVVIVLTPFIAIYLGIVVADENYLLLGLITAAIFAAIAMGLAHKHLLTIGLTLAILDLWIAPLGFKTSSMEQSGIIAFSLWLLIFWRKDFNSDAPASFRKSNLYGVFTASTVIAFLYVGMHFVYNMWYPYESNAFGWKGASKAYLQAFGPLLMIVVIMASRILLPLDAKRSKTLFFVFFLAYVVSLIVKCAYLLKSGPLDGEVLSLTEKSEMSRTFYIPVLNIWDSYYTLRTAAPAATLVGATCYFCGKMPKIRLVSFLLMSLGLIGSLISGGRATLLFSLAFIAAALIHSGRKVETFIASILLAALLSILFLLPTSVLQNMPWQVQRSVAMVRSDLKTQAADSIKGSTDMREDYFLYAWNYWRSGDFRLLLTGRSVGSMEAQDIQMFQASDPNVIFFAIRRIATHNGLTDMLIGWGALGYLLALISWIFCFLMLNSYNTRFVAGSWGDCWVFIGKIFFAFWLIYTHIGGGFIWPLCIWLILIALAQTDGFKVLHRERKNFPFLVGESSKERQQEIEPVSEKPNRVRIVT